MQDPVADAAPKAPEPADNPLPVDHAFLSAAVQLSEDAVIGMTPDTTIVAWNPAAEELYGYPAEEAIGKSFRMLVPPSEIAEHERMRTILQVTGSGISQEALRLRKDGSTVAVSTQVHPVRDASGETVGLCSITRDLTHHRQALERTQQLLSVSRALSGAVTTDEIAEAILDAAQTIFQATMGLVVQPSEDGATLRSLRIVGVSPELAATWREFSADAPVPLADAIRRRELLVLSTNDEREGAYPQFPTERAAGPGALVAVPLLAGDRCVGGLGLICPAERCQDDEQRTFLWTLAGQCALALERGRLYDAAQQAAAEREQALREAQERADRDPLTGLVNHRAFYKKLEQEMERSRRDNSDMAVVMMDLDNFKLFNDLYGHATGDQVLRQVADRLCNASRPYDTVARFGGDEFALLLSNVGPATARNIEDRMQRALNGMAYRASEKEPEIPIRASVGVALSRYDTGESHMLVHQANERLQRLKTGQADDPDAQPVRTWAMNSVGGFSMLDALVTAVDNKDRYTRHHSEDVMRYSVAIAQALGFSEAERRTVALAALLHDLGKIGVPDSILRKPGRLTEPEFDAVKQHPQMGAIIVASVPGLEETLDAVRHHHERWDGGGYPFGLRGEETPLMARLMAVADAFSAMTTDRPYRKGMDLERACSILREGAGTQWDPGCVTAFLKTAALDLGICR
jgi:diguanylate cyclase (GGDEF)-like protein/PAS domain S-box-containing protein